MLFYFIVYVSAFHSIQVEVYMRWAQHRQTSDFCSSSHFRLLNALAHLSGPVLRDIDSTDCTTRIFALSNIYQMEGLVSNISYFFHSNIHDAFFLFCERIPLHSSGGLHAVKTQHISWLCSYSHFRLLNAFAHLSGPVLICFTRYRLYRLHETNLCTEMEWFVSNVSYFSYSNIHDAFLSGVF